MHVVGADYQLSRLRKLTRSVCDRSSRSSDDGSVGGHILRDHRLAPTIARSPIRTPGKLSHSYRRGQIARLALRKASSGRGTRQEMGLLGPVDQAFTTWHGRRLLVGRLINSGAALTRCDSIARRHAWIARPWPGPAEVLSGRHSSSHHFSPRACVPEKGCSVLP